MVNPLLDYSGNGRSLTANGSPLRRNAPSGIARFAGGYDFNGSGQSLTSTDATLITLTNHVSFFISFEMDVLDASLATVLLFVGNTSGSDSTNAFSLAITTSGALTVNHYNGTSAVSNTITASLSTGPHRLWIKRDNTGKTLNWELDGSAGNTTYTGNVSPSGNTTFSLGGITGSAGNTLDGGIYEVRVWNTLVADATLQAIASTTDKTYDNRREGTELAYWQFEDWTLDDSSGNGRILTMTGTVPQVPAPSGYVPFGSGFGPFSTSNYLFCQNSAFGLTGDCAAFVSFLYDGSNSGEENIITCENTVTTQGDYLNVGVFNTNVIFYRDAGAGQVSTGKTLSAGQHVLTVRRIGTAAVIKLDGIQIASITTTASQSPTGTVPRLSIGAEDTGGSPVNVASSFSIQEVRLWNATNTPSQAALDAIAVSLSPTYPAEGNEIAFYRFEEGNRLVDSSGNGRTLTMTGTVPFVQEGEQFEKFGKGVGPFSGSAYLSREDSAFALTGASALTLLFSFDGTSAANEFLIDSATSVGNDYFAIQFTSSNKIRYFHVNGGTGVSHDGANVISAGFHRLTLLKTASNISVYVDGVQEINQSYTSYTPTGTGTTFRIGDQANDSSAPFISGNIYEVRIWGATNTPSQVTLDQIVSLTDHTYLNRPEGNEIAYYRFEQPETQNASGNSGYNKTISIQPWSYISASGAPTYADVAGGSLKNLVVQKPSTVQNDEIVYNVTLASGIYTIETLAIQSNDYGIASIQLDSVPVGEIDYYNATAPTRNVLQSITGVYVPVGGKKELKFKMATKRAASGGYFYGLQGIYLRRTS